MKPESLPPALEAKLRQLAEELKEVVGRWLPDTEAAHDDATTTDTRAEAR